MTKHKQIKDYLYAELKYILTERYGSLSDGLMPYASYNRIQQIIQGNLVSDLYLHLELALIREIDHDEA